MESTSTKKLPRPIQILQTGCIMQAHSEKAFVSVCPAYEIGKIRWTAVEKGSAGAKHLDFFMDVDDMRQLCEEIRGFERDGVPLFFRKLQEDAASKYPSAYKYVGGENGCKKLAIGGGKAGARVQINVDDKYRVVPVPLKEFRNLAEYFSLTYEVWTEMCKAAFKVFLNKTWEEKKNAGAEVESNFYGDGDSEADPEENEAFSGTLHLNAGVTKAENGNYSISAENGIFTLIIPAERLEAKYVKSLINKANSEDVTVNVVGEKFGEFIFFDKFIEKKGE